MVIIKKRFFTIVFTFIILLSQFVVGVNAAKATVTPSGINDGASYLLKVPEEGNYIYYSSWKAHGLSWTSFKNFCKNKYNPDEFNFSENSGYIHTKTLNGENFYEAEFNMEAITFDTLDGCNIIAIQPVQIQFDKTAFENGENVPLGNYIDTTPYKYVATRIKIEGGKDYQKKVLSVMLRAKGRDQYIDNMVGTYLINNKTHTVSGPTPDMKYIEVENGFDGWIVMPVDDMAEGKPLSELVTVSFFCHSKGFDREKCGHGAYDTAWDDSTLYIGDMMLVKDIEKFKTARTSCNVLGHKYGEPVIIKSTTTKEGSSTVTCSICKNRKTTAIAKLTSTIKGNKVEGLAATAEVIGNSNITYDVILKADNVTKSIATKEKNAVIRGVNSLRDKIKSRKLASILDLRLVTKENNTSTEFKLDGTVKLTVPIDSKTLNKYKDISLVLVADDGTAELLNYTIKDGKAIFETQGFGYFAFVGREKTADDLTSATESEGNIADNDFEITSSDTESETKNNEIITNQKTEKNKDNKNITFNIVLISVAGVVALGLIILALILIIKN